ncbi:cytochrome P450 [Actinoplanes sp. KI2]|uniref:cytochrome P450 n=1 Tax=Actinoplanes sp. KI2 TaxID=2983315 RepID=UPI0021D5F466|nr:cytochrome P450 [Actinoplanes sp. KI2]MCU7728482.1 cytochrome P450 [Actinoplanes sp. KI2]
MVTSPPATDPDGLPRLPFRQPDLLEVPPEALDLQARCPVSRVRTPTGDTAWLVTGYDEVRRVYADDRFGMSHRSPQTAPRLGASLLLGGPNGDFDTQPAERLKARARLAPYFSPKRMRAFRPRVEALTESMLAAIEAAGPPADLHADLSVRLPVTVICELLGVDERDRYRFREWTQGVADVSDRERSLTALTELMSFTQDLVARKRAEPGNDVISALCRDEDGTIPDGYIAFLAAMLLFAGHETTVVRLDHAILLMLAHPDQRTAAFAEPGRLAPAVEEILRVVVHGGVRETLRWAREDVPLGDVTIGDGDLVVLYSAAANRDAQVFGNPCEFDVSRPPRPHVTLGFGAHYCLGAPLVRMELEAVLSRIFTRFPGLHLTVPMDRLEARREVLTGGLAALPVAW